ncbi:MAG: PIN domain-containing protein [Actinomycetota bacterium]
MSEALTHAPLAAPHLADSTVWSKVRSSLAPGWAEWFNSEVREGRIQTCNPVALEILRSARDSAAFSSQSALLDLLQDCPIGPREWKRARTVQALLAARSQHRGVPPQDFLIAAAAESAGISLLHYDHDYDLIAAVTGQPVRWLAPAGSLP